MFIQLLFLLGSTGFPTCEAVISKYCIVLCYDELSVWDIAAWYIFSALVWTS